MGSALDGTRARGIDVYHGRPVRSFSALAAAPEKIAFMGVKASEGDAFADPKLAWHRDGFRASDMDLCLYYHFARPGDARAQARRFVSLVGPLEPRERLCLDLEVPIAASPAAALEWLNAFYGELMGNLCSDRRPFLYTSDNKWDEICGGKPWLLGNTDVDLWAKRYSTHADLLPLIPTPWKDRGYHVWQFSDSVTPPHSIAGVGPCDGDVWNGDRASLRAYVHASMMPTPTAPPAPVA